MNFNSLDDSNVPEEPDFGNIWDGIEEQWQKEQVGEPSLVGNLPQKTAEAQSGIEQNMLSLSKKTSGVVSLSIYPDGSGSVKVEYIFNDASEIDKVLRSIK